MFPQPEMLYPHIFPSLACPSNVNSNKTSTMRSFLGIYSVFPTSAISIMCLLHNTFNYLKLSHEFTDLLFIVPSILPSHQVSWQQELCLASCCILNAWGKCCHIGGSTKVSFHWINRWREFLKFYKIRFWNNIHIYQLFLLVCLEKSFGWAASLLAICLKHESDKND